MASFPVSTPPNAIEMSSIPSQAYHALIRTHHITSKKKIAALRQAARSNACYVMLKTGSPPGVMYCEGNETGVKDWVACVQVALPQSTLPCYYLIKHDMLTRKIEAAIQGLPISSQTIAHSGAAVYGARAAASQRRPSHCRLGQRCGRRDGQAGCP
jgi:hypothetical protein